VAVGAESSSDWFNGYYQYANRLAALAHLRQHSVGARLVFIYFCGDRRPDAANCPNSATGWQEALAKQDKHLGLPENHPLADRVHKLLLPVWREGPSGG